LKDLLWAQLNELSYVIDSPWCLVRDFNDWESPNEKRGGQVAMPHRFTRLNTFLAAISAESVRVNRCLFTRKKRIHTHLVYERLDWAIVRTDWSQIYPKACVIYGCFACLDHCRVILTMHIVQERQKAYPFCFQNFWAQYQRSTEIIRKTWRTPVVGTRMFQVVKKLKNVKYELKTWAKHHFGNFQDKVTKNEGKIKYVETKLLDNPSSFRLNSWMHHILK